MRKNNLIFKGLLSCLLIGCLFSVCSAATTAQGRNMLSKLRAEGRTDEEIKTAIEDLGLDYNGYFPNSNSSTNNSSKTTQQGRNVLNQLRKEGRTDDEIKSKMKKAGIDTSGYFPDSSGSSKSSSSTNGVLYTSRSCKTYDIEYLNNLGVYSSKNLIRTEYFVSIDYFKRYIDSKNPQKAGCPTNVGWISNPYYDSSDSTYRYTAPNGKVYFIINQNGYYTSNELSKPKNFGTINELKNYIRERNPLIRMGSSETTQNMSSSNSNKTSSNNVDCEDPIKVATCILGMDCPKECQA